MKAKIPPSAIMTKAQKEAAEEWGNRILRNGLNEIIPQLENLIIIAAVDSGLKQRTIQRIIDHYELLFYEFIDDLLVDTGLARNKIKVAMEQREIEATFFDSKFDCF